MSWQEPAALAIVAVTAAIFLWKRLRPRRFTLERDTHCGCAAGHGTRPQESVIYRARKGERPQVLVKMK